MDTFQEKMMTYANFGFSMGTRTAENGEYYIVNIKFKPSWKVVDPANDIVFFIKPEDSNGKYVYFTETKNGMTPIFNAIDETIAYNEEVEKKVELFRSKVETLQNIFAEESIEKLMELQFTFPTEKKRPGRPAKAKPTKEEQELAPAEVPNPPAPMPEEPTTEKTTSPQPKKGENKEEASDIDAKIAAALKQ